MCQMHNPEVMKVRETMQFCLEYFRGLCQPYTDRATITLL